MIYSVTRTALSSPPSLSIAGLQFMEVSSEALSPLAVLCIMNGARVAERFFRCTVFLLAGAGVGTLTPG